MRTVFADTYFYLALLGRDDRQRQRVEAVAAAIEARTLTTTWVLVEVANAVADPPARLSYPVLASHLRNSSLVDVVPASQELLERGEALYAARTDKGWSLTDCISFVVMQERGLTEALTAEHHFEQAGFVALLK